MAGLEIPAWDPETALLIGTIYWKHSCCTWATAASNGSSGSIS